MKTFFTHSIRALAVLAFLLTTHFGSYAQSLSCCEGNLIKNPDFEIATIAGNGSFYGCSGSGGTSVQSWCGLGSPQVYVAGAFNNSNAIKFWGIGTNFPVGEGIYQAVNFLAGSSYDISFRARFSDQVPTGPDSVIFRFRAYSSAPTSVNDPSGTLIGEFVVKNTSPGVFSLNPWIAPANYSYLVITVHNNSAINHGNYVSWGVIDDICMTQTRKLIKTSSVFSDPQSLSLYPNPAEEKIWVEYPADWGQPSECQLIDLQGRQTQGKLLTNQTGHFEVDLTGLASGMYFLSATFSDQNRKISRQFVKE